jgi:hypothetical protein
MITSDEIYSALELFDAALSHPERRNASPAPAIARPRFNSSEKGRMRQRHGITCLGAQ